MTGGTTGREVWTDGGRSARGRRFEFPIGSAERRRTWGAGGEQAGRRARFENPIGASWGRAGSLGSGARCADAAMAGARLAGGGGRESAGVASRDAGSPLRAPSRQDSILFIYLLAKRRRASSIIGKKKRSLASRSRPYGFSSICEPGLASRTPYPGASVHHRITRTRVVPLCDVS